MLSRLIVRFHIKRFSVGVYGVLKAPHGEQRIPLVVRALKIRAPILSFLGKLMKELLALGGLTSLK